MKFLLRQSLFTLFSGLASACAASGDAPPAEVGPSVASAIRERQSTYCEAPGAEPSSTVTVLVTDVTKKTGDQAYRAHAAMVDDGARMASGARVFDATSSARVLATGGTAAGADFELVLGPMDGSGNAAGDITLFEPGFVETAPHAPVTCSIPKAKLVMGCRTFAETSAKDFELGQLKVASAADPHVSQEGDSETLGASGTGVAARIRYNVHLASTSDDAGGEWPAHLTYFVEIDATVDGNGVACAVHGTPELVDSFM